MFFRVFYFELYVFYIYDSSDTFYKRYRDSDFEKKYRDTVSRATCITIFTTPVKSVPSFLPANPLNLALSVVVVLCPVMH